MSIIDRLRGVGLGEQALKAALAAGVAWFVGGLVPGSPPQPYLAPLTAMLTVQLTIAESLTRALQRTLGATLGVIVAVLAGGVLGVNAITVAVLVVIGQVIGALLRLSAIGTSQVMVTALLVLTIGSSTTNFNYGWARIAETIVGALIGVGVNALLAPPSHISAAASATRATASLLRAELQQIAAGLASGLTPELARTSYEQSRAVVREFEATRQTIQRAEQSLRFNIRAAGKQARLDSVRGQVEALERSAIQTRTLARVLRDAALDRTPWLARALLGELLADLVSQVVLLVDDFTTLNVADMRAHGDIFAARRAALLTRARQDPASLGPEEWLRLAALLATIDRLASDLRGEARVDKEDEAVESG